MADILTGAYPLVCFLSVSVYRQSRVMKNLPAPCILFTMIVLLRRSWFEFLFPRVVPSLKPFSTGNKISALLQSYNFSRAKHKAAKQL